MRIEYDAEAQALEIELAEAAVARTVEIDSGTLVDLAADGTVVAIEVIRPGRQWPLPEILDQFEVDADATAMPTALWPRQGQQRGFAFGQPTPLAALSG